MQFLGADDCAVNSLPVVQFLELDGDHDLLLDRNDLLRYGSHGLTYRIVDRIFAGAPRRRTSPQVCHLCSVWQALRICLLQMALPEAQPPDQSWQSLTA